MESGEFGGFAQEDGLSASLPARVHFIGVCGPVWGRSLCCFGRKGWR